MMTHPGAGERPRALAIAALILSLFSTTGTRAACAQTSDSANQAPDPAPQATHPVQQPNKFTPGIDLSLGVFGQFTTSRVVTSTEVNLLSGTELSELTQAASPSGGALTTLHESFRPWLGYNINFGYSRMTEQYSHGEDFVPFGTNPPPAVNGFIRGDVRTGVYEVTLASVVEGPRTRRFTTFAQLGGGQLFFEPNNSAIQARMQPRTTMVFGAGANFKLSEHLDLRAEYRGLFYRSPNFNVPVITPGFAGTEAFPMTSLFTVTSTPTVSLVYRFGRRKDVSPHANGR